MFTGEHERRLDDKWRLVLPPVFRRDLHDAAFLSRSPTDPCLLMYSEEGVEAVAARLDERVRRGEASLNMQRRWSASITEVRADAQGRIAIPPKLRDQVGLGRDVVVIGVVNRAEIWDKDAWQAVESAADDDAGSEGPWI